jgi:hypothetical protein
VGRRLRGQSSRPRQQPQIEPAQQGKTEREWEGARTENSRRRMLVHPFLLCPPLARCAGASQSSRVFFLSFPFLCEGPSRGGPRGTGAGPGGRAHRTTEGGRRGAHIQERWSGTVFRGAPRCGELWDSRHTAPHPNGEADGVGLGWFTVGSPPPCALTPLSFPPFLSLHRRHHAYAHHIARAARIRAGRLPAQAWKMVRKHARSTRAHAIAHAPKKERQ